MFDLESLLADHWDAVVTKITEEIRFFCLVVLFTLFACDQTVADQAVLAAGKHEWLLYSAKGARAPDGSSSAAVVGIIRADGSAEQYPDFGVPGQKGWQLGPQLADGSFVARSFEDTTTAAAVSGKRNGSTWLFDFKSGRIERELLTDFDGGNSDISVDLVLPGGRLLVGVIHKNGQRQLYDMDLSGGERAGNYVCGRRLLLRYAPQPRRQFAFPVISPVASATLRVDLIESPFRVGLLCDQRPGTEWPTAHTGARRGGPSVLRPPLVTRRAFSDLSGLPPAEGPRPHSRRPGHGDRRRYCTEWVAHPPIDD